MKPSDAEVVAVKLAAEVLGARKWWRETDAVLTTLGSCGESDRFHRVVMDTITIVLVLGGDIEDARREGGQTIRRLAGFIESDPINIVAGLVEVEP